MPTTLTANIVSGVSTYGGAIQKGVNGQDIALTKTGSGTLLLSGSNNYSGGTDVNSGTLIAAASGAIPDGSNLTVGAGAILVLDSTATSAGPVSGSSAEPSAGNVVAVPEPGTLALLIAGVVVGFGVWQRKKPIINPAITVIAFDKLASGPSLAIRPSADRPHTFRRSSISQFVAAWYTNGGVIPVIMTAYSDKKRQIRVRAVKMGCKAIARGLIVVVVASAASVHADVFNMGGTISGGLDGPCKPAICDRGRSRQRGGPMTTGGNSYGSVRLHLPDGHVRRDDRTVLAFLNSVATKSDPYGLYNSGMAITSLVSDIWHRANAEVRAATATRSRAATGRT